MSLLPIRQPRRFNYRPRFNSEDDSKRTIEFRRITLFDPHDTYRYPRLLIVLLALVVLLLWLLGGPRRLGKPFQLTPEDAVRTAIPLVINITL